MRWHKRLYVGEIAKQKKYKIIGKIRYHRLQINAYVIALPSNKNNLLDIFPSYELLQNYYRSRDMMIVGIACGYDEALEVVRNIIHDIYNNTGGFDVEEYFANR